MAGVQTHLHSSLQLKKLKTMLSALGQIACSLQALLQPSSQEGHGQPHGAAGNQSASRNQLLEYQQDKQVKILPLVHVILDTTPYV